MLLELHYNPDKAVGWAPGGLVSQDTVVLVLLLWWLPLVLAVVRMCR